MVIALDKLSEMYKEGLILENYGEKATHGVTDGKYENYLQKNNLGFSTYDYNQTQTVYNDPGNDNHPAGVDNYLFAAALPAVVDWKGNRQYFHYTESWRSVKTEGWFITAATAKDSAKLARALKLFDYLYSTEGNKLMSYGPTAWVDGTTKYLGKDVPALSAKALNELKTLAKGNYTNYYRRYLGATYPVGYVKEQGMEYQCVAAAAQPATLRLENAIATGVLKHPNFNTDNTDHMLDITPTTYSFTEAQSKVISGDKYQNLNKTMSYSKTSGYSNFWNNLVQGGFDLKGDKNVWGSMAKYQEYVGTTLGCDTYIKFFDAAYRRMGM